ncbi:MAG: AbrB/MazE/SpoVT family DNA-binding domain-containing protein [Microbacterium sp.]|uniref:AbrB/MazE/SpoVT family DNA-binding domain-containing protein n=1 Tax=Microbacterium sp. TaxID=51671 RepID=UPI0039E6A934
MSIATMTSKGQITVPKDVREDLNLTAGSKVMFVKLHNGQYRLVARTGKIQDLFGILYDPARPPMTIEDINEAIAEGGAASGMQGLE